MEQSRASREADSRPAVSLFKLSSVVQTEILIGYNSMGTNGSQAAQTIHSHESAKLGE